MATPGQLASAFVSVRTNSVAIPADRQLYLKTTHLQDLPPHLLSFIKKSFYMVACRKSILRSSHCVHVTNEVQQNAIILHLSSLIIIIKACQFVW